MDFIIEREGKLTPIEVKWTDNRTLGDARHKARHQGMSSVISLPCRTKRTLALNP